MMKLLELKGPKLIALPLIWVLIFACTSNPLFKEDQIKSEQLSGQILLNDETTPDNIYVWLEGFNLGTLTDSQGRFSLSIPSPETRGLGSNFNGEVNLYFYVANYYIDSTTIIFANGKLLEDQAAIDSVGELSTTMTLRKIASVVTFAAQTLTNPNVLKFYITLTSCDYNIKVYSLRELLKHPQTGFIRTGIIIESLENSQLIIFIDRPESFLWGDVLLAAEPQEWRYDINLEIFALPAGHYRIVPYLLFPQNGIPDDLLESISGTVEKFDKDYLLLPIKREGGDFEIR
jgi:hypothetical protein